MTLMETYTWPLEGKGDAFGSPNHPSGKVVSVDGTAKSLQAMKTRGAEGIRNGRWLAKPSSGTTRLGWASRLCGESRLASEALSEVVSDDRRPGAKPMVESRAFERLGHPNRVLGEDGVDKLAFGQARLVDGSLVIGECHRASWPLTSSRFDPSPLARVSISKFKFRLAHRK